MKTTLRLIHIYQLSYDKGVIFYEPADYIVFYTKVSCCAKKFGLRLAGLCIMLNHFHIAVVSELAPSISDTISKFMAELKLNFAKEYNSYYGRSGPLFMRGFGSAVKRDEKAMRTHLAYLFNNPVEKRICARAEGYKWNFLAYAVSNRPFSERIPLRFASHRFRKATDSVKILARRNKPIGYHVMELINRNLDKVEKKMLIDYIISKYMCIDWNIGIKLFGGYGKMVNAFSFNTGSEYDIVEYYEKSNYAGYRELLSVASKMGYTGRNRLFLSDNYHDATDLARRFRQSTSASQFQISSFLHIPLDRC